MRDDEDIKKDIVDQLYWDGRVDASNVQVSVGGGRVTLTGNVHSYSARKIASSHAGEVPGVLEVDNRIAVGAPGTYQAPADETLEAAATRTLEWDPDMGNELDTIRLRAGKGKITLEGSVDAYWKKIKAENLVSNLRGVKEFENRLTVVPTESADDQMVAGNILAAFDRTVFLNPEKITVEVKDGAVTLSGMVPSFGVREMAHNIALYTPGVQRIRNRIKVGG